jgi:hypothetical protein
MEQGTQVESFLLSHFPGFESCPVKGQQSLVFVSELLLVVVQQVSKAFSDLEARLHAHRSFRQRANQRFERHLRAVSSLIVVVIRVDPAEFVTGYKGASGPDNHVVQNVPHGQQFRKCRLVQGSLTLFDSRGH